MATVTKWTPFEVALDLTATGGTVVRKSATQFTVVINASWETYYSGAKTNYGMTASSGGGSVSLNPFGTASDGGSGSFTGTYSISGNGSATKSIAVTFRNFNTDNENSATKNVTFSVTVPAWTSYKVTYNANGGSGAPGSQTKWKDQTLTLSSTKPTRTGYSFLGWSTSSSATSATYSAGGSYTANSAATLYAVWKANTYTVKYNANGGSGAPANQTKTHGVTMVISSTKPVRVNYKFKGWATSSTATAVAYTAGGNYSSNASITLYAVWELTYIKPAITNVIVERCDGDGVESDDGTYGKVIFDWKTYQNATNCAIRWASSGGESGTLNVAISGTSGTVTQVFGNGELDIETTYSITIALSDANSGVSDITRTLFGYKFPIDVLNGEVGTGVSIGKPATKKDTFEVALNNEFLGTTTQIGNRFTYSAIGVSGQAGYIKMVSIELINDNANWPITFIFNRRKTPTPTTVHLTFNTSSVADSTSTLSSFVYEGSDMAIYLLNSQPMVWDIYVQKANENDTITLQDWYTSTNMDKRIKLSFPGEIVSSVPSGSTRCTSAHLRSVLDFIYPVGSIYMSWSHSNPGTLFGGTWTRIQNTFLWATDSSGTIGQTGGEKTHVLSQAEMPTHSHVINGANTATGSSEAQYKLRYNSTATGYFRDISTETTGSGQAHNNMPPYTQVSIWRRTA